jgi:hypothetical protein
MPVSESPKGAGRLKTRPMCTPARRRPGQARPAGPVAGRESGPLATARRRRSAADSAESDHNRSPWTCLADMVPTPLRLGRALKEARQKGRFVTVC